MQREEGTIEREEFVRPPSEPCGEAEQVRARLVDGRIELRARGVHRTAGYEVYFVRDHEEGPLAFRLVHRAPMPALAGVRMASRFDVQDSFDVDAAQLPVRSVRVAVRGVVRVLDVEADE